MIRTILRRLAVLGLAGLPLAAQQPAPPRLVVLCSCDQLASWVLQEGLPFCGEDGFRRLQRDGVDFTHCAYLHGCTETGPGHATLGTGAPEGRHGIVRNEWYDLASKKSVYCVADPDVPALPAWPEGKQRSARWLLVPTVGDLLKEHLPAAKVVGVSWKDRAAILMSGRKADLALWIEATTGRLVTNTAYTATPPQWLVAFDEVPPLDRFFAWKWQRCAADAAYADLVDDRPFEVPHGNGRRQRTLPQVVDGGKDAPSPAFYAEAFVSPICNEVTLLAAEAAIEGEGLGADAVPDLLCVSFSATDPVGHGFGPDSVEARDTLLRLDRALARLLGYLDLHIGRDRYVFVLSADHGVGPVPEIAKAAGLDAGRGPILLRARAAAEKALSALCDPPLGGRCIEATAGMSFYFDRAQLQRAAAANGVDLATTVQRACELAAPAVAKVPGMLTSFAAAELLSHGPGSDPIRRAMYQAVLPGRSGDLLLVPKPYWLDGATPASHGTPHPYDRAVPLLAMGPGLRAGLRCEAPVSPGLGAVLISRLLDMPPPPASLDTVPDGVLDR